MARIIITEEQFKKILLSEQKVYSDYDKSYDYRVVNGKWQAKKKSGGNWFSLDKYPTSIKRLDDKYPNARKGKTSSGKKSTKTTSKSTNDLVNKYGGGTMDNRVRKYFKGNYVDKDFKPTKSVDVKPTDSIDYKDSKYFNIMSKNFQNLGKNSAMMTTVTESPFKNKAQGDAFRKWLNDTLPKTAEKLDVDPPSSKTSYKNKYIVNALNHVIHPKIKGEKVSMTIYVYYSHKHPDWMKINQKNASKKDWDTKTELKRQAIEAGAIPVPEVVKNADRINKEVAFINAREEYNGKPFFIADPRLNLVVAFDEKHNYIAHSQSVAGADFQKPKVFSRKDWCKSSGGRWIQMDNKQHNIKINGCYKKNKDKLGVFDDPNDTLENMVVDAETETDKVLKKDKKRAVRGEEYPQLKKTADRYAAAGIYKVSGTKEDRYVKNWDYPEGTIDTYLLRTKDGVSVGAAIHALVNTGEKSPRVEADKELKNYLQKAVEDNEVPKEYIDLVEKDFLRKEEGEESKYDLSSGCFNVNPKFATNPKIQKIGKAGAYVFILSEDEVDYLVQVERGKEGDFLLDAGGKKEGFCKSPSQLTDDYGEMVA